MYGANSYNKEGSGIFSHLWKKRIVVPYKY